MVLIEEVLHLEQRLEAMEVFRIAKVIDNEMLDLQLAIGQLKKEKEQLSQSLKRRKNIVVQMNGYLLSLFHVCK